MCEFPDNTNALYGFTCKVNPLFARFYPPAILRGGGTNLAHKLRKDCMYKVFYKDSALVSIVEFIKYLIFFLILRGMVIFLM